MAEHMTKRERSIAAMKGEPVDRVPLSFFGHNHQAECSSDTTAAHLLKQNSKFGWDFIKVHLRSSYYGEAWGSKYRWEPKGGPIVEDLAIKSIDDLKRMEKQDPTKGVLGDQVRVAKLLGEALKGSVPYVQTVFTPLNVTRDITGIRVGTPSKGVIKTRQFMKENPEALHYGLSAISQTLADYAREVIRAGADGIFMSTAPWTHDTITEEEYKIFGRPYDLPIYEATIEEGATFNILHICQQNIMFGLLSDYPVQVINYDVLSPRNPSLQEAMSNSDKALWGGINEKVTLLNGPVDAIVSEVHAAVEQTKGKRLFLGPGCSIPPQTPDTHLIAAKDALFI